MKKYFGMRVLMAIPTILGVFLAVFLIIRQNGRMVQQSTGIGLYLCKRLCEKLGIGITAESSEHGTAVSLSFHINCLIHEVQS